MQYRNQQRLQLDGVTVRLSANPRARRISIRLDPRSGEVVATAPNERRLGEAVAFAQSRRRWIAERLARRPAASLFAPGGTAPLFGQELPLVANGGRGAARLEPVDGDLSIVSGGEGEAFSRRVERLIRDEARRVLTARTEAHLATLGLKPVKVSMGDPRSRWGSCSPHNRSIRYSWRVAMAPPEVVDYLAAHEVAHLVHADHSPAYWRVVERLIGDHRPYRKWLREHGARLHALGRPGADEGDAAGE